ncbi:MAG: Flp pilus assembly complex ATPase component TadA, partial [Planctomycetes bacterium]|nr:Flp pilus assembly complex ATPase component TadA [Planctomycetota bacterium]
MATTITITDRTTGKSGEAVIDGKVFSIGKSGENHLVLDQTAISRRHCRIEVHGNALMVRDTGSRNGTFIDGRRLDPQVPVPFDENSILQAGDYIIKLKGNSRNPERPPVKAGEVRNPHIDNSAPKGKGDTTSPKASPLARNDDRRVIPVELKREVHAKLLERMDLKHTDMTNRSANELRLATEEVCTSIVQEMASRLPTWLVPGELVKDVVDEAIGLGLLEDLLADDEVDEIMVVGWSKVYVERQGKLVLTPKQFTDDQQVIAIMRRILAPIGRRIDETNPMADGRLADGSRVNAVIPPLALSGPTLTIRKFATTPFVITDLINRFNCMTDEMGRFLELSDTNRANILISGGTGSGK